MAAEEGESVSLRGALLVVVRRRRVILGVYLGVLVLAVAALFVLPPQYRIAAKVLVTSNRADISTNAEKSTELVRASEVGLADLNSQLEILRSRDLVGQVLREMGSPEDKAPAPPARSRNVVRTILGGPTALLQVAYDRLHGLDVVGPEGPQAARVERIRKATEASALRNTNVLEVAFTGADPVWARDYVNRLVGAYVEQQARMQSETGAETFFTSQSELLRQKLAASEAALRAEREKAGTLNGQQTEVHDRLNEFSAELARTRIARSEQEQRAAFLERLRGGGGQARTPELLALEAKRADLLGRYRADSERVRAMDEQIQRLRAALTHYNDSVVPGDPQTDLTAARASLAALKGKEAALALQEEEYRRQTELLDAQSFDLARLERQVKLDEEAYLSYVRTAEQSRLSNALQQSKMLRLAVLEPARVPNGPVSPDPGRILSLAVVGGLAMSLACGFIVDRLDTTVKSATDVRRCGDMEVLAVFPERV